MAALGCNGGAEHATSFTQHEIDLLLSNLFGGDNKVAFILAVFVVDHNYKFAASQLFHGLVYGIQFDFVHIFWSLVLS